MTNILKAVRNIFGINSLRTKRLRSTSGDTGEIDSHGSGRDFVAASLTFFFMIFPGTLVLDRVTNTWRTLLYYYGKKKKSPNVSKIRDRIGRGVRGGGDWGQGGVFFY